MAWVDAVLTKLFHNPAAIGGAVNEMITPALPIWIAFVVGLFIGWAWRPRWANLDRNKLMARIAVFSAPSSPCKNLSTQTLNPPIESCSNNLLEDRPVNGSEALISSDPKSGGVKKRSLKSRVLDHPLVNEEDLIHLAKLVEVKDGGPSWIPMMDRSTSTMVYRAWRRDPPNGPPQYRSSTIFEDAAPEIVRDFFWDDEFRLTNKWDDMLIHSKTLEECSTTGTRMVQWIRKFPFFCSDREYIIGRRIWESGRTYYCVTKGVPCTSIPRKDKPRRVDLYYSSWCIRPVESRRGDGQMTSCEVLLFHHEDMGIPWEIAKLGVRQGMWGAVKKIEPGLRAYQKARASGEPLYKPVCTNVSPELLRTLLNGDADGVGDASSSGIDKEVGPPEKKGGVNVPKIILISGAVALACSLDRGLLTKAVIFGAARRFGRIGGRVR